MILELSTDCLTSFWTAFGISAVTSFPIMKLLVAMKSRQTVSQHAPDTHQVKQGTPTMGGLIILAGVLGALPFAHMSTSVWPMYLLILLFALIGFVDDFVVPRMMAGKRGLGWKQKIVMQLVFAIIPLAMAGYTSPLPLAYGTFMILFFANAYNFSDGLDGLAGTLLLGLLVGMFGMTAVSGQEAGYSNTAIFVFLGAILPFLYWNAPKAKVFMGDVGSLPIGAFLGGFWFLAAPRLPQFAEFGHTLQPTQHSMTFYVALGIWSLMMVAELVPVPLQIGSVKLFKRKIFPYTPIHHAFEKAGWPETRVVFVFAICQLVCSMLAITLVAWFR
ncbi:MAG: hypothetical protein GC165_15275 [Armatimonadetes bacterium]|nr:hypothetical protein [Armatimonadota bacterium]MBS1725566.1 hypothetical protein [Armatimonadota bacterium]